MSSYASIVKVGVQPLTQDQLAEMINDPDMQTSWGDLVESEKKIPHNSKKSDVKQKGKQDYVSDLYKEHPIFPLSPIKSIKEKQIKLLHQKSGITPIKNPPVKEEVQLQQVQVKQRQQKSVKEPLLSSPSDPKPLSFSTKPEEQSQVQKSTIKIRTHNPTEEELFGNTSSIDDKKENLVLISAYDATIKVQQKEIADNAEVIENQKYSMKEYSKGINTNQSNIAIQHQTINDNVEKISNQKHEIINLSTQINTLRTSFEYYTNELNKTYSAWQQYCNALKGVQLQFTAESQKHQELVQQNAELEQEVQAQQQRQMQLIAYNHQVQQLQQSQAQLHQVPQYVMQYPPVYYPQQVQQQVQTPQYMTVPIPPPEFMNAFMHAMATASAESSV